MSESKYTSAVRQIPAPIERVYPALSNLQNLERVREHIPADRVRELEITYYMWGIPFTLHTRTPQA